MKKVISLVLYKNNRRENEYVDIVALVNNENYIFKLEDVKTSLSKEVFIRENNEFKFNLDIKNQKCTYLLKEQNMLFDIDVEKISYNKENNTIILEYTISTDEENFKIILEDKGELNE